MFQLLGGYYIIRLILYHLVRSGFFVFGVGPGYPSMELVPVFGLPVRPLPSALFQKAPGYSRPYMLGYLLSQAAAQRSAAISATTRLTPCPGGREPPHRKKGGMEIRSQGAKFKYDLAGIPQTIASTIVGQGVSLVVAEIAADRCAAAWLSR